MTQPQRSGSRINPWWIIGAFVAVVAVFAAIALLSGGDDELTVDAGAAADASADGSGDGGDGGAGEPTAGPTPEPTTPPVVTEFGTVTVSGAALSPLPETGVDGMVGSTAPSITSNDFTGAPTAIEPGQGVRVVVFLAHWCPHCNNEAPRLASAIAAGIPEGVSVVVVPTGSNEGYPNWPPSAWVADMGLSGLPLVVDDAAGTIGQAFGLSSYPYIVLLDDSNTVLGRIAGEQPDGFFAQLFDEAAAAV
ncbi:MAG: redoxin domain-containing protein [Acidimicrobiales bacterium]|nr:redoxin domain-containing protein [Acidimicrobiales bacterium]